MTADLEGYKQTAEYATWHQSHAWDGYEWASETCTVAGCERSPGTRGLCRMHYQRLRKHGTTDAPDPVAAHARATETLRRKHQALFEEVVFRLEYGDHPLLIAQEFGFKPDSFARWCYRHGHKEEAALFERGNWDRRNKKEAA